MKKKDIKKLWTLRPGDFRPERLKEILDYIGYSQKAIEQFGLSGCLFDCKEDAIEASIAIRSELVKLKSIRQERQEHTRRSEMHSSNSLSYLHSALLEKIRALGNRSHFDGQQSPTLQNASRPLDGNSPETNLKILVTIQIHS